MIAFVDDRAEVSALLSFPRVGTLADLQRLAREYPAAAVGIGEARARLGLLDRCRELGFQLPWIVHPSAVVSEFASLGDGTVVFPQAVVNAGAVLQRGCIVNTAATVDHDCELGEGVHVCPGTHLAGSVVVGARAWIGIGASVKQGVRIGSDATIGAGAAVVSGVEAGTTVIGVPARRKQGDTR
jgi:sugar O-acyltransferase (sialic acid O-acetyltransferase NeuD family)